MRRRHIGDHTPEHVMNDTVDIIVFKDEVALLIHCLSLLAHDIVILQQLFTGIVVDAFNTALCRGDGLCDCL